MFSFTYSSSPQGNFVTCCCATKAVHRLVPLAHKVTLSLFVEDKQGNYVTFCQKQTR